MKPARRGLLVALEGIDGAGKTTLQRRLAVRWRSLGYRVRTVREPNDRGLGAEALRVTARNPSWAAALFTLDRWVARPRLRALLSSPTIVLMDRSFYSTLAYQGGLLPVAKRRQLERLQRQVAEVPDRVIFLDLAAEGGVGRVRRRGSRRSPAERANFLRTVERTYRSLSQRMDWITVDARRTPEELVAETLRRLGPLVRRRLGTPRRHA